MKIFMRIVGLGLLAFLGAALILGLLIYAMQDSMIFHPRGYNQPRPAELRALETTLPIGRQVSYVADFRTDRSVPPTQLWMFFNGNASVARDWWQYRTWPSGVEGSMFAYVEYPGYGESQGRPTPESILAASEAVFAALADELGLPPNELAERTVLVGHSMGAAAAMQFATQHPPAHVVLLNPFTSLLDMARLTVPPPYHLLLRHRLDNRARLGELARLPSPPRVWIIHGDRDDVIPLRMGEELARLHPAIVTLRVVPGDHVSTLEDLERLMPELLPPSSAASGAESASPWKEPATP